nr:MAG TPA: hypothetical protein [Caudoviricetes sp.]
MVNNEGLKIVYDDVAPYAKENSLPQIIKAGLYPRKGLYPHAGLYPKQTTIERQFPDLRRDDLSYPGYALCYPGFSLLNGDYINFPDDPADYGYVSSEYSDDNGNFGYQISKQGLKPHTALYPRIFLFPGGTQETVMNNPALTITFNGKFTSVGILFTFNMLSGDYAKDLNVKWYEDTTLLANQDFTADGVRYFCNQYVHNYSKIVITFKSTSNPHRPVFLTRIDYGIYRDFLDDELMQTDCLQEINAISENISINTLSFTVRTKSNIPFDLQKKQRLGFYFNGDLLGNFYLKSGARKNKTDYYMDSHDALGVLDGNEYVGGIYTGRKLSEVLTEIFANEDFSYTLDDAYKDMTLTGYIPYTTKRNALVQIAFAIGAIVDTSNVEGVDIYPQATEVTGEFDEHTTFTGLTLEHSDIVTGVRLTTHTYTQILETEELYKDALNGTAEIVFSEPHHSLSISGGTIVRSGVNYAVVTGTGGTVTLIGGKYSHNTSVIAKDNPDIVYNKNIKEVTDATLINPSNGQMALERIYAYYQRAENVVGDVLLGDKKLGDKVRVDTGYDGIREGIIESIDPTFTREIKARVTIHE